MKMYIRDKIVPDYKLKGQDNKVVVDVATER
jgi:hypothetical protein